MVFLHFWTCKVLEEYSDKCVENDKCVEKRRTGLFLPVYLPHPNWSFEHSINHRLWPQAFSVEDSEVAINREPQRSRACGRCSPWCWTEAPARLRLAVSLYPSAPPHFRFRLLLVLFVGTPPCYRPVSHGSRSYIRPSDSSAGLSQIWPAFSLFRSQSTDLSRRGIIMNYGKWIMKEIRGLGREMWQVKHDIYRSLLTYQTMTFLIACKVISFLYSLILGRFRYEGKYWVRWKYGWRKGC